MHVRVASAVNAHDTGKVDMTAESPSVPINAVAFTAAEAAETAEWHSEVDYG